MVWHDRCGDVVLTLRDGSKLEVRSLPDFERNYNYIRDRTSARYEQNETGRRKQIRPKDKADSKAKRYTRVAKPREEKATK